jgi:hypothetical protein
MTNYDINGEEYSTCTITVNPPDDGGIWTVMVYWIDGTTMRPRSYGVLCSYAELPLVLCEVAHEVTGFITLASDGAFG